MDEPIVPSSEDGPTISNESGNQAIEHLLFFSNPLSQIPLKVMFSTMVSLVKESLFVAFSTLGSHAITSAGFILLNMTGNSEGQAHLGIVFSYNLIFFYGFFLSLVDKLGIDLSLNYGAGDHEATKRSLNQGIYTAVLAFLGLTVPSFAFGKYVLMFAGIEEDEAISCGEILIWLLLPDMLECTSDLIRTFCMAQGQEAIFGPTFLIAVIVSVVCAYILIVQWGLGVIGWVMSKVIFEGICLCISLWVMQTRTPKSTRGILPFSKVKKGFKYFFYESLKFAVGSYSEFIGYEVASLFVYRTNNQIQIAGYSQAINISSLVYSIGESVAVICRTRMNLLIGKGLNRTSKNFFMFFIFGIFLFGGCLGGGFFILRPFVVSLFTSSDQNLSKLFDSLMKIYSFAMPFELTLPTAFMGIKTIGSINYLLFLNAFLLIVVNIGSCYYWSVHLQKDAIAVFANLFCIFSCLNILCTLKVVMTDWSNRELDYNPAEDIHIFPQTTTPIRAIISKNSFRDEIIAKRKIERMDSNIMNTTNYEQTEGISVELQCIHFLNRVDKPEVNKLERAHSGSLL